MSSKPITDTCWGTLSPKSLKFGKRHQLSIRFPIFNVFNPHSYGDPNTGIGTKEFGDVGTYDATNDHYYASGRVAGPRIGQFGMRFTF